VVRLESMVHRSVAIESSVVVTSVIKILNVVISVNSNVMRMNVDNALKKSIKTVYVADRLFRLNVIRNMPNV